MNKSTSRTDEHKSAKRGQYINNHGYGGVRRCGQSEPAVEANPGQLYNRRRWMSDDRQKDINQSRYHCEKKKALNSSKYRPTNVKVTEAKIDVPGSAPIRDRNRHAAVEPVHDSMNEPLDDQASDMKSDVTEVQSEIPPSIEQTERAKKRKKKKKRRNKKSLSDQRRSDLRHHKNPFLVDDDALEVDDDDDDMEGDDEQETSQDDYEEKRRSSRERKKKRRCSHRDLEQSSSWEAEKKVKTVNIPSIALKHESQTNPHLKGNTKLRNIPQEYRKRAAALRTRSPTDFMLNGFSKASMRVFEFATGACANADCAYTTRTRTDACNRNAPCVTSQLPPILARGIVGGGRVQQISCLDDTSEQGQRYFAGSTSFTHSSLPPLLNLHREHAQWDGNHN